MRSTKFSTAALAVVFTLITMAAFAAEGDELGAMERAFQKAAAKVAGAVVAIECDRVEKTAPMRKPGRTIRPRRKPNPKPKLDPKKPERKLVPRPKLKKQYRMDGEDKDSPVAEKPPRKPNPRRRTPFRPRRGGDFRKRPDAPFSGVLIKGGYVLTTAFNMGGNCSNIKVTLSDGRRFDAQMLGIDETRDLAMLKLNTNDALPSIDLPLTVTIETGKFVVVVGRSESIPNHSVTTGIVSSTERSDGKLVQIDAKLNYGNAGGAVTDLEGKFIGIASGVSTRFTYGICSGVGFMTPVDSILKSLSGLKAGKVIKRPKQPFLGVQADQADNSPGAHIGTVYPNTAAERAGLKNGDTVFEFQGQKITSWQDMVKEIRKLKVGDKFSCKVRRTGRDGKTEEVDINGIVGERPLGR